MCTLTWRAAVEGGYDLFFNRDELDRRPAERGPVAERRQGVRCVAPRDGAGEGTWLTLNEHGVTFALLNHYPAGRRRVQAARTRGIIPLHASPAETAEEAVARVAAVGELAQFAPFHGVAVDAESRSAWLTWDGAVLQSRTAPAMLTSSSFDTARVETSRQARFAEMREPSVEDLLAFHRTHDARDGAASVCMRREDGGTRSVCAVRVRAHGRLLTYRALTWSTNSVATWDAPVVVAP